MQQLGVFESNRLVDSIFAARRGDESPEILRNKIANTRMNFAELMSKVQDLLEVDLKTCISRGFYKMDRGLANAKISFKAMKEAICMSRNLVNDKEMFKTLTQLNRKIDQNPGIVNYDGKDFEVLIYQALFPDQASKF